MKKKILTASESKNGSLLSYPKTKTYRNSQSKVLISDGSNRVNSDIVFTEGCCIFREVEPAIIAIKGYFVSLFLLLILEAFMQLTILFWPIRIFVNTTSQCLARQVSCIFCGKLPHDCMGITRYVFLFSLHQSIFNDLFLHRKNKILIIKLIYKYLINTFISKTIIFLALIFCFCLCTF